MSGFFRALSVKDLKIIIIDHGCTDCTAGMIENEFPEVILLKGKGDLWRTSVTNIGVNMHSSKGYRMHNDT